MFLFCYRANDSFKIIIITVENERKRQLAQINYHADIFSTVRRQRLYPAAFFCNSQGSSSALFSCRLTPAVLINNYGEPRNFNVLTQWRKIWSMRSLKNCAFHNARSTGEYLKVDISSVNGKCFFIYIYL